MNFFDDLLIHRANPDELSEIPLEFFQIGELNGKEFRAIPIPEQAFINASPEEREHMMVRNEKAVFYSQVARENMTEDAVIVDQNDQRMELKQWVGERDFVPLTSEQFTLLHAKISLIALRTLETEYRR